MTAEEMERFSMITGAKQVGRDLINQGKEMLIRANSDESKWFADMQNKYEFTETLVHVNAQTRTIRDGNI
jgi:hypothetical protein